VALNPMFKRTELEQELKDAECGIVVCADTLYPELAPVRELVGLKHVFVTADEDFAAPGPSVRSETGGTAGAETKDFRDLLGVEVPVAPVNRVEDLREDLALLQYTGGTTGLPKGAMITHHALASAAAAGNNWFRHGPEDVYLGVTPYFHIMGMVMCMCGPLLAGGRIVLMPRFRPDDVARAIVEERVTIWVAAGTMVVALLQSPVAARYDFSSLRYLLCGGASFTPELQQKATELAPQAEIMEGYGLTESVAHGGVVTPPGRRKAGFSGVPHANEVRIADRVTGERFLPPNEAGEIVIKGPAMFRGYWRNPQETAKVLRNGWLHTGDVGLMDEEGYFQVMGRDRELIKCSGFSVFPADVEDLLYRHPAVGEVAVIGVPDAYRGESPKAFVVLHPEFVGRISEEELLVWAKEKMAAYKCPREVEFCDALPKSGVGKLLRRVLVDKEATRARGT